MSTAGSDGSGGRHDVWGGGVPRVVRRAQPRHTPAGAPRSSGVVYAVAGDRLYVAVAENSWKARHIGAEGKVAVTVPVHRGGPLALITSIPPATIRFPAVATAHPAEIVDRHPGLARVAVN